MTDHKAEWVLVPRVPTAEMLHIGKHAAPYRAADVYAAMIAAAPAASEGEDVRLWDSQWVNVVNHANCYEDFTKEEAVAHAVKMTEQYMRANITAGFPNTRPAAQVAATPKHDEGVKALWRGWRHEFDGGETECFDEPDTGCKKCYPVVLISASDFDALATQPAARRVTDGPDWRGLYRTQTAMRYMDASPQLSLADAQRMADEDIQRLESFAQPAEGVSGG